MSEKITFKELVELIAKQSQQSQSSANSFIHELVQIIESGLKSSGSVSISGFGKFELRWMNERTGTHPQTGEEITIPGQNKVVFKPYKALREEVNAPFAGLKSRIIREEVDEAIPPASDTAGNNGKNETIDDLIIERDNPHFVIPEKQTAETNGNKPVAAKLPDESKLAEEVQKSSNYKWAYAAAVMIALIAFILLFFMMQRDSDTAEAPAAIQMEQVTPPVAEDTTPADDPDPGIQTEFETESFTVEPGQSLWTIAENQLGNPYLWPVLYNLNRDLLTNPNQLPAASELDVPSISDPENLNEFEREQVALGYFSLYEWNRENNPEEARYFLWAVGVFSPELLAQPPSEADPTDLAFARNR